MERKIYKFIFNFFIYLQYVLQLQEDVVRNVVYYSDFLLNDFKFLRLKIYVGYCYKFFYYVFKIFFEKILLFFDDV